MELHISSIAPRRAKPGSQKERTTRRCSPQASPEAVTDTDIRAAPFGAPVMSAICVLEPGEFEKTQTKAQL